MKQKHGVRPVWMVIGMLGLLAIAHGFDRLIIYMKEYVTQTHRGIVWMLLLQPVVTIILSLAAFLLFWFLTVRSKKNAVISTVFVVFGFLMLLLPLSLIQPLSSSLFWLQPFIMPSTNLFIASAAITAIGILNFFLPELK